MYKMTVYVAARGTPLSTGVPSDTGHMWFTLDSGQEGGLKSYGFAPKDTKNTVLPVQGEVKKTDSKNYRSHAYYRTIEITESQYNDLTNFANRPDAYGFDTSNYWLLNNSCVDFVWKALDIAGVNRTGYEGSLIPVANIEDLRKFVELSSIEIKRVDDFLKTAFPLSWDKDSLPGIDDQCNRYTTQALNWVAPRRDPLVLDLDGNGITTSGINPASPILFDQDGDGIKNATGWIASGEAIVVRDLNGNGTIDSGREIFGDNTILTNGPKAGQTAANGFEALADLDSNKDGKFNASDAAFASVKLWKDFNQNGRSDAGELFSFADLNVQSINVGGAASNLDLGGGNTQTFTGSFTTSGGATGAAGTAQLAGSLLLSNNNFYREFTDDPALTTASMSSPDMKGSGLVRDLRAAMSLGTTQSLALQTQVTQFATDTRDGQLLHLNELIQSWGNTSAMQTSIQTSTTLANTAAGAGSITAVAKFAQTNPELYAKITTLEQFNGQTILDKWVRATSNGGNAVIYSPEQETLIGQAYDALKESVYGALVMQTRLKPYLDSIGLTVDSTGAKFDTAPLLAMLEAKKASNESGAFLDAAELDHYATSTMKATGAEVRQKLFEWMVALPSESPLWAVLKAPGIIRNFQFGSTFKESAVDDIFIGDAGANIIQGGGGNTKLFGGAGNDAIYGDAGDDVIVGGKDNDYYQNNYFGYAYGNDTYQFSKGDGIDTINDYDTTVGNIDTVQFMDVASTELTGVYNSSNNLVITYGASDQVTIVHYFSREGARIEQFKFSDNVTWGLSDIQSIAINRGTAENDTLTGYNDGPNQMEGLAGNDVLTGASKNDTLSGGDGNDKLYGGAGNDTMHGDAGDDLMVGGTGNDNFQGNYYGYNYGNDTYQFSKGDGIDTVNDTDTTTGNVDTVQFMDVASTELTGIYNSGGNLVITYGSSEQVTIINYFGQAANQIEQFKFSDNVTWLDVDIKDKVIFQGTAGNDTLTGTSGNDNLFGMDGSDTLSGKEGNDRLYGGAGDDTIYGDAGDDLIVGGTGNDNFQNNYNGYAYGNDTYQFSKGDGIDFINDYDATVGNIDTVQFMDVASTELTGIFNSGGNLVITYGVSDKITINNYFVREGARIEQFKFSDNVTWSFADIQSIAINRGTAGNDTLTGYNDGPNQMEGLAGNDTLIGGSKNDTLGGGDGNDSLSGKEGNDRLYGGAGDDTIYGDVGDDIMVGGTGNDNFQNNYNGYAYGNDIYQFSKGDGIDTINDYDTTVGNIDTVQFMDVASTELTGIYNSGGHLVLTYGSSDKVTINNYFNQASARIEQLKFSDGITWGVAEIQSIGVNRGTAGNDTLTGYNDGPNQMEGLAGNDILNGASKNDTLNGGDGNDTLTGKDGNDRLYGGAGDDIIYGDAGDDLMVGGTGDDNFKGNYNGYAYGNDIYQFSKGDGVDVISDYDPTAGNIDTVQFMDVASTELTGIYNSGGNLVVTYGSSDQVTINSYFNQVATQIEQFKFSDNVTWSVADIKTKAVFKGTSGNDTLVGTAGNDTFDGGAGTDTLRGAAGNDTYKFGLGYGVDTIQDNDTTVGNVDVLQFLSGTIIDQLWFKQTGNHLEVSLIGTTDKAVIADWYLGKQYHVEEFKTSDGKILLDTQVQNLVNAMAGFAPPAAGQTTLPASYESTLMPVITANWH